MKTAKILVAEDDKSYANVYKLKLTKEGYEVFVAYDGKEAIAVAKEQKPDLVLLDLIMPEVDGFEVIEVLKKDEGTKHIPIIVLSNLGQDTDIKKVLALGAKAHYVKANISIQDVVSEIKKELS